MVGNTNIRKLGELTRTERQQRQMLISSEVSSLVIGSFNNLTSESQIS